MSTVAALFPLLWFLAFLSPIPAIVCAALFYSRHRRARPERRLPALAYASILLVCAILAYPFGLSFGASLACSDPTFGNLCGLFGFFVTGPFASSLAIFLVGSLVMLLPPDEEP
jgi:hypothetical protein